MVEEERVWGGKESFSTYDLKCNFGKKRAEHIKQIVLVKGRGGRKDGHKNLHCLQKFDYPTCVCVCVCGIMV